MSACDGEANPLKHIDVLFKGVLKNTDCCNLNFYGNIHSFDVDDTSILTQNKREYKKSQKRQLEELVVPNEVYISLNTTIDFNKLVRIIFVILGGK